MPDLNTITYETFGIEPGEFYATKFAVGQLNMAAISDKFLATPEEYRFRYLVDEFAHMFPGSKAGLKVLDVGCGSGRFGGYLKFKFPEIHVTGMELSEACRDLAFFHGYEEFVVASQLDEIPLPSQTFDFVTSMDLFGHIEFRYKDAMIAEMWRILKPGGKAFHGVETGVIDYFTSTPDHPDDPIRRYVWIDGHVGVETPRDTIRRFEKKFDVTRVLPMLFPCHDIETLLSCNLLGDRFREIYERFHCDEKQEFANFICSSIYDYLLAGLHGGSGHRQTAEVYLSDDAGNKFPLPHGNFSLLSMTAR